mgnify:CR=1 FL=1
MKEKLLMVIFLLVLGSILTTALVAVNYYTKPTIEKNEELKLKRNILRALKLDFQEEEIEEVFEENVTVKEKGGRTFFIARTEKVAFLFEGSGLWGPIRGAIAMDTALTTIDGITIIYQEETPGLGSRIAEREYLDKFIGKKFSPELELTGEGKAVEENEIDAITGATLSSDALIRILNNNYREYNEAFKGE